MWANSTQMMPHREAWTKALMPQISQTFLWFNRRSRCLWEWWLAKVEQEEFRLNRRLTRSERHHSMMEGTVKHSISSMDQIQASAALYPIVWQTIRWMEPHNQPKSLHLVPSYGHWCKIWKRLKISTSQSRILAPNMNDQLTVTSAWHQQPVQSRFRVQTAQTAETNTCIASFSPSTSLSKVLNKFSNNNPGKYRNLPSWASGDSLVRTKHGNSRKWKTHSWTAFGNREPMHPTRVQRRATLWSTLFRSRRRILTNGHRCHTEETHLSKWNP